MKIPQLHIINYAGFMDLKDEPYYEAKSVLNVEDYPEAELIAEEVARRCNYHNDLLEALEGLQDMLNNHYGDDPEETHLIDKAFDAIKKARGL